MTTAPLSALPIDSLQPLIIDRQPLSVTDVVDVARRGRVIGIGPGAQAAMEASRGMVAALVERGEVVYGVTTGFGKLADMAIPREAVSLLQRNLLLSHSVGVGEPLPRDVVRAMMLLRASSLALGYSGIRPETVELLVQMLNRGITPVVPSRGSVGASGDLAPLAHLALVLIGAGQAEIGGRRVPGGAALAEAGLEPVELQAKEGLALINGTQLMTAVGALLVDDAANVLDVADIAGAMSLEAMRGTDRAFDARAMALRPHAGQGHAATRLRSLLTGSEILPSHRFDSHRVQDPYSLRCMPQVHGASRDALGLLCRAVDTEMSSVTDNPLIFPVDGEVISCGNFHGEPLAIPLDVAAIALAEIGGISERRIEAMLDPHFSELPAFLTMHGGVDSGFMVSQYTAASLVSENKILSHPASVDSIPTSANQEDHVSMGATAALKVRQVLANVEYILAIELLCAAEGLDYRLPLRTSPPLEAVRDLIRSEVPHLDDDRVLAPDIECVNSMIRDRRLAGAASALIDG
ncbi:MAG TPA: histidine ammonia-lyase [Chloroflexota bacterium]|nr:histidine ammonia-lyase [Chloroflexota bacterium]